MFPVALTQVAEGKKNQEFGHNKEQRLPARIVSGAGSLKSHGSLKSGIGEGWGMFFSKAASKGFPRPFNAAGWRCSQGMKVNTADHFVRNSGGSTRDTEKLQELEGGYGAGDKGSGCPQDQ